MRRSTSGPKPRTRATVMPPTESGWHSLDPSITPRRYLERTPIS